ncbi:MAG: VWA domain-containing protein [Chloroflexota bacterium]
MLTITSPGYLLLLLAPAALALFAFARRGMTGGNARRILQPVLRCIALVLLIVALAQPEWGRSSSIGAVALIIDTSSSITSADRAVEADWLEAETAHASAANPVITIVFGGSSLVVTLREPPSHSQVVQLLKARGDSTETNLAGALRLAAKFVPAGARLILLTDGDQTVGDAEAVIPDLTAVHLSLYTVLLSRQENDTAITRLSVPPFSSVGSDLPTEITVSSTRQVTTTVSLRMDGQDLGSQALGLRPGNNPYLISVPAPPAGRHVVSVRIKTPGDTIAANNSLEAVTEVSGTPKVLVVTADPATSKAVALFRDSTLSITAVTPSGIPSAAAKLNRYAGVVLDDIPATDLKAKQVAALDAAVKQHGVGLYVLGGSHSLTQGHYSQTALEKMLPVLSVTPASLQDGNVALQLVLDRSGSMDNLAGDVPKIVMARGAAQLAANFVIQHLDDLGIVAFDQASHILWPIGKVAAADKAHVSRVIAGMFSDGGTNIYQALQTGIQQVSKSNAPYRHIILMTDGRSDPANYLPLLKEAQQLKITISTVGLGPDADVQLLHYIAVVGKGRFYYTTNANDLPRIFAEEARLAAGSAAVIGKIGVKIATNSPTIRSLGAGPVPQLSGYTATVLKKDAVNDLETNVAGRKPDPLLARGQYGLGRVLVWTPGVENTWSASWRDSEPAFWSDSLRWTLRGPSVPTFAPALGGGADPDSIVIDTLKNSGKAVDLQRLAIDVRTPTGGQAHLLATQTAPGLYEAAYAFPTAGVYQVTVRPLTGNGTPTTGLLAVPYSPEYRPSAPDGALLATLSARTAGAAVHSPAQVSVASMNTGGPRELWWPLALLGLIVFMAAVAVGRLTEGSESEST